MISKTALPDGLAAPRAQPDGLDSAFWDGTLRHELRLQRCKACARFQWGPEWMCHRCMTSELAWEIVAPHGTIYSWERVWHPVHPSLSAAVPYIVVLVELPHADGVRLIGNLLGDAKQEVIIGSYVRAVFEDHTSDNGNYTLVQWELHAS